MILNKHLKLVVIDLGKNNLYLLSVQKITDWFIEKNTPCVRIDDDKRKGWGVFLKFNGTTIRVDFVVDDFFPFSEIKVFLHESVKLVRKYPHLEERKICLFRSNVYFNYHDPIKKIEQTITQTLLLFSDWEKENFQTDFQNEWKAYWRVHCNHNRKDSCKWFLGCAPENIKEGFLCSTKNVSYGTIILAKYNCQEKYTNNGTFVKDVVLFQINKILSPEEYPFDLKSLQNLILRYGNRDVIKLLKEAVVKNKIKIILLAPGKALFGFYFEYGIYINTKKTNEILDKLKDIKLVPCIVERADVSWVFGRDNNVNLNMLSKKTVMIIGCGSVGSFIAHDLAKSGVGKLILIDNEKLESSNISRHVLGAYYVNSMKTDGLKNFLKIMYPTIEIVSCAETWEQTFNDKDRKFYFKEADLIISTTASLSSELNLNYINKELRKSIIYAWTEAYAIAGHIVAIVNQESCLECGVSKEENDLLIKPFNIKGEYEKQDNECGAIFVPYGIIELNYITSLAAQTSIDFLLGKVFKNIHRVWIASEEFIKSVTAFECLKDWEQKYGKIKYGAIHEIPWDKNNHCEICNGN